MVIKHTYWADPIPTQIIRVVAKTARNPGIEVARIEYTAPHLNPRNIVLFVPTPEVHWLEVYETPGGATVGVLKARFVVTPVFESGQAFDPIQIKVGNGRDIDPSNGDTEVDIPQMAGYTVTAFNQWGAGDLPAENPTVPGGVWRQNGTKIELLGGLTFGHGEWFTIHFKPFTNQNVSTAIFDVTALLNSHIENTGNPHGVTKAQVGLSNIPNQISDSYQLDDSDTLATSKALFDALASIESKIIGGGSVNIGSIPGNSDQIKPGLEHGFTVAGNYNIIGSLRGVGSNWNADNDTFAVVRNKTSTTFDLSLRNVSGATANLWYDFLLIKIG